MAATYRFKDNKTPESFCPQLLHETPVRLTGVARSKNGMNLMCVIQLLTEITKTQ